MRQEAHRRITATAEQIAASTGAKARVRFGPVAYSVTHNPAALTEASLPALKLATGGKAKVIPKLSGSEDFSEFQKVVPGFFYFLGAPPAGQDFAKAPTSHSALFDIDERQLPTGARSLAALAVDYLQRNAQCAMKACRALTPRRCRSRARGLTTGPGRTVSR